MQRIAKGEGIIMKGFIVGTVLTAFTWLATYSYEYVNHTSELGAFIDAHNQTSAEVLRDMYTE